MLSGLVFLGSCCGVGVVWLVMVRVFLLWVCWGGSCRCVVVWLVVC